MILINQKTNVCCSPACLRMVLREFGKIISEKEAVDLLKTTKKGTKFYNLYSVIQQETETECYLIDLNIEFRDYERFLRLNSFGRIVVLTARFIRKGQPERFHSIVCHEGMIYDPGENEPLPIESYYHLFSKLILQQVILVEFEKKILTKTTIFDKK